MYVVDDDVLARLGIYRIDATKARNHLPPTPLPLCLHHKETIGLGKQRIADRLHPCAQLQRGFHGDKGTISNRVPTLTHIENFDRAGQHLRKQKITGTTSGDDSVQEE